MGIDLLENSELAALAPSRLGNKSFVDDNNYSYISFENKEKATASHIKQVNIEWAINPKYKNDCSYLQKQYDKLIAKIDSENKKGYIKRLRERFINPLEDWAAKYKAAIIESECVVKKEQAEKSAEQKNTLDTLTSITNAPPPLIPTGEKANDNTNKYIIYGVGGVILLIAVAILIK
jgi:hypothetical protein